MKNFLLILGSPLWIPLLIAGMAVILSLYAVLWALVASLWAIFAALICAAVYGFAVGAFSFPAPLESPLNVAYIGLAAFVLGLAIFLFFGCISATRGTAKIPALAVSAIKGSI